MIAVDTNVLVHAHREECANHKVSLAALRHLAVGVVPWGLPVFAVGEFVRVVTHPRLFSPPSTIRDAFRSVRGLLECPSCRVLSPGRHFASHFESMCDEGGMTGNMVFDAQIAAVCIEHGATDILTFDRDFRRIPGIRIVKPESLT